MTDPHHHPLGNLMDNRVVHRVFGAGTAAGWTACGQLIVHFTSGITKHLSPLELSTTMEPPQAVEPPQAATPEYEKRYMCCALAMLSKTPFVGEYCPAIAREVYFRARDVTEPYVRKLPIGWVAVFPVEREVKWFLSKRKALYSLGYNP